MMLHPTQNTLKTTRLLAKKVIHKSINTALEITGLIGLYFYSLLSPSYEIGTSTFMKMTNKDTQVPKEPHDPYPPNHTSTEKRKRNNTPPRRHWKVLKPHHWDMSKILTKVIILTIMSLYYIDNLHKMVINRKLYNLAHNTRFTRQRGNAFPIKPETMIKDRKRIQKMNEREQRMKEI